MMMKLRFVLSICGSVLFLASSKAQQSDSVVFFIKRIYEQALTTQQSYQWLHHLSENIGGRLAGSSQAAASVEYTRQVIDTVGVDTTFLQACTVPRWSRGKKEIVRMLANGITGQADLRCLALGFSGATPNGGITAPVIEVKSLDELDKLGQAVKGKIVFFNRRMDPRHFHAFAGYGGAVDQRVYGPAKAAKYGAVAALVRSMTGQIDEWPHTGVTVFEDNRKAIPAVAISTLDAELLSQNLQKGPVSVFVETTCAYLGEAPGHNVIGEWTGSEFPDKLIITGGHLDSWDVGGGAHDDGAGCVHSIEALNLLHSLGYKPRHTIRTVMFMNEENGLAGGLKYAEIAKLDSKKHLAAIESDSGGFTPKGFSFDGDSSVIAKYKHLFKDWESVLSPYQIYFNKGGSGADIGPLKPQQVLMFGLSTDSQRYFDYHHTERDRITAVSGRELALGSAAIASLIYLIDQSID